MKLRFADARTWRYVISTISKIIDEGVYRFSKDGIRLKSIDPSRVVLVDFIIPSEGLVEYDIEREEQVGVDMEDLAKILRRAIKDDELELKTLEANRLAISFIGKGVRTFIIPSLETVAEEIGELSIPFTVKAKISPSVFKDIIKELEPVGDTIEFTTIKDENKMIIKTSSDIAEVEIEASIENGALIELEAQEDARAIYSMDYLSDIVTASQAANELIFEYGTGIPCKIEYLLPYGGKLIFYVAPRSE